MSIARGGLVRRAIAGPLLLLTSLSGLAGPFLELADLPTATVIESEHDPASCPAPHDHRICTQVGANHAASSLRSDAWEAPPARPGTQPATVPGLKASASFRRARARAPPSS